MTTIMHLDASARTTRSLSRSLSRLFVDTWVEHRPADRVISRDLASDPPPHVSEAWIAATFTSAEKRNAASAFHTGLVRAGHRRG
jgi:FMN-dependent NADH-azoreductase